MVTVLEVVGQLVFKVAVVEPDHPRFHTVRIHEVGWVVDLADIIGAACHPAGRFDGEVRKLADRDLGFINIEEFINGLGKGNINFIYLNFGNLLVPDLVKLNNFRLCQFFQVTGGNGRTQPQVRRQLLDAELFLRQ